MHNVVLLLTKCFLIMRAQPKLVGKIMVRTPDLISRLYNCMAVDRLGYAYYSHSQGATERMHSTLSVR